MGLLDIFGKKDVGKITKGIPFEIKTSFNPVRISASRNGKCDLEIKIKNKSEETVLTSLVVKVEKDLGLDELGLQKVKEIRLGYLGKGEEHTINVPMWSSSASKPGEAVVNLSAFVHYRTYSYILNSLKKALTLRIV